jgi:type II secretory pathway pseudopilin PulG
MHRRRILRQCSPKKQSAKLRNESGILLLELLVAIGVSGIIAAALASNLAAIQRFANKGQSNILAANIAQQIIDSARNTSFTNLNSQMGTYVMLVNKDVLSQTGPAINPRPLLIDNTTSTWSDATNQNRFAPSVTEIISNGPNYPRDISVEVRIDWEEDNATKHYWLKTLVTENGINN